MICPDCKWESPDVSYSVRRDGKVYVYQPNETPSEKAYPKILDQYIDWKGRLVFREVHKCSKCLREFEQTVIKETECRKLTKEEQRLYNNSIDKLFVDTGLTLFE